MAAVFKDFQSLYDNKAKLLHYSSYDDMPPDILNGMRAFRIRYKSTITEEEDINSITTYSYPNREKCKKNIEYDSNI